MEEITLKIVQCFVSCYMVDVGTDNKPKGWNGLLAVPTRLHLTEFYNDYNNCKDYLPLNCADAFLVWLYCTKL